MGGGACRRRRAFRVGYERGIRAVLEEKRWEDDRDRSDENVKHFTCVMKFGGSSVASVERMKEIAHLIQSFNEEMPVIVLSAMGKTTNKLLLVIHYHSYFIFILSIVNFIMRLSISI